MTDVRCGRIEDDLVGLLEGSETEALREHVASCDACRDARHELEELAARIAQAGSDFTVDDALGERLEALASEARISKTRLRTGDAAASASRKPGPRRRLWWLAVAGCVSVSASAALGLVLADRHAASPEAVATRAFRGKVAKVVRSGPDGAGGLSRATPSGSTDLAEGAEIGPGAQIVTDARTRARLELDDGTVIALDRATRLTFAEAARTVRLDDGAILADVATMPGAAPAVVETKAADVRILGTKLAVTVSEDRTNVEVLRGEVEVGGERISAGQEGVVSKGGRVDVAPVNDLAQRAAFGEALVTTHNEDAEAPVSGLGELRAKRPGKSEEKDHAVRLARHAVKIRIAGNVARTEIDEEFFNDTDAELEGIYRFPLPPGAQIERLALDVDGELLDGEFLDKAKAQAIWRGAIQNAAPKAPRPKEEIVWVPGPWHDPALLEWQRGGRFELRIFPIPKKASRRVVIAYTETVAPVSGRRRYVYPLPQGSSSKLTIDAFSIDAQVLGHDRAQPVRARGYELEHQAEGDVARLRGQMSSFTPSGDLAIEYGLGDPKSEATVWSFAPPPDAGPKNDPVGPEPFVAIALRPRLPGWTDARPRDQVIVIDAGRTMFGERFARAKRLAVQMAQEMDRRDRVTVLACDVTCRAMAGGLVAPGAPTAHDVDAFLAGVTPDGASDLVSAVRAARGRASRDPGRDLRVVLLSDGVATAGYRSKARVADEVSEALEDPRAQLVTVPIGADADTVLLGELARGGGGVVVPYQPGQRLEATALEVLNATYGTTLSDVEIVLPEGLRDVAPAALPPLRAGAEAIVTARMAADSVKGDVVLRGKVGGDPFEARYPIDVRATSSAGNAFVPRLFAGARIADREREPGDGHKAELIALSRRFAVPSRFTSLLVLESEAMFRAFGIERAAHAPRWTGEVAAQSQAVQAAGSSGLADRADDDILGGADEIGFGSAEGTLSGLARSDLGTRGFGSGGGGRSASGPVASQAPAPVAPPPAPAKAARPLPKPSRDAREPFAEAEEQRRRRPLPDDRGGQLMKRIFVRKATIHGSGASVVAAEKIQSARAAVQASPDERDKHKELARLLAVSGQLDELDETLERWSLRDPLDADVIVARSDLAARRGDREGSMRILGGALAASALSAQDAFVLASTIARGYERLGRSEACAFHVAAAELRSSDVSAVARAVACERAHGRERAAERWMLVAKEGAPRAALAKAVAKTSSGKAETATGDVVVAARWSGGADLDVALLDPSGRRAGVATRLKGARVEGALSRDHETLALASGEAGPFVVEIVRTSLDDMTTPIDGKVTIRAFGQTQTVPFVLRGPRVQVARVDVRWQAELVPVSLDAVDRPPGLRPFDRLGAARALERVSVAHCAAPGEVGRGRATVTFLPSGAVSNVVVTDGRFAGTPVARCVQSAFFGAQVPPFAGPATHVAKTFTLGVPLAR
jgi:hypothetical protein